MNKSRICSLVALFCCAKAWQPGKVDSRVNSRRQVMIVIGSSAVSLLRPSTANAGIDPSLLQNLPVQGDESGAAQRLRQVEAVNKPASDLVNIPFTELPGGVSYREYREGKGEAGTLVLSCVLAATILS